jgi:hypothetical protein
MALTKVTKDGIADTLDLSSKTVTLPSASVTAHVTQTDTTTIENNIAMLGFFRAADNSKAKYSLVDQVIDEYVDASGIDTGTSTNETLTSGVYSVGSTSFTQAFSYTGSEQSWSPSITADVTVQLWGAGGGGDSWGGGGGGYTTGTLAVTSGQSFKVIVGGGGEGDAGDSDRAGGYGGGGSGHEDPGGAGYAGIFLTSTSYANAKAIAGGGGGADANYGGGGGGGATGNDGAGANAGYGRGGTQSAGGATGAAQLTGGNASTSNRWTGGGGGGYWGGGAPNQADCSGGGGSGYIGGLTSATTTAGGNGAQGGIGAAAGTSASNYSANTGNGGDGSESTATARNGQNGYAFLSWAGTPYASMTLQSTATTAESAPTTGDIVILIEDATGTATINTDIKAYISRDGSAFSSSVTLVDEGDWGTNKRILAAHNVDISGITSGTAMKYKIITSNQSGSKETRVHATSLAWA